MRMVYKTAFSALFLLAFCVVALAVDLPLIRAHVTPEYASLTASILDLLERQSEEE